MPMPMSDLEHAALVVAVADSANFGEIIGNSSSSSSKQAGLAEPELQQLETLLNIATTFVATHISARAGGGLVCTASHSNQAPSWVISPRSRAGVVCVISHAVKAGLTKNDRGKLKLGSLGLISKEVSWFREILG